MIRVNFNLTAEQLDRLKALARQTGLTVSELIRRAVDEFLDREAQKRKER